MPRIFTKKQSFNPQDLIHYGLDHINAAEKLFGTSPSYFDSAGYLLHMGFELLFKAWHLEVFGEFPGIHSLISLVEELQSKGQQLSLSEEERSVLEIADAYSELRYPNPAVGTEVGSYDWERIDNFLNAIWEQTPDIFDEYFESINPTRKGGRVLMQRRIEKQNDS
jgi:HEPN domain-containing protein